MVPNIAALYSNPYAGFIKWTDILKVNRLSYIYRLSLSFWSRINYPDNCYDSYIEKVDVDYTKAINRKLNSKNTT